MRSGPELIASRRTQLHESRNPARGARGLPQPHSAGHAGYGRQRRLPRTLPRDRARRSAPGSSRRRPGRELRTATGRMRRELGRRGLAPARRRARDDCCRSPRAQARFSRSRPTSRTCSGRRISCSGCSSGSRPRHLQVVCDPYNVPVGEPPGRAGARDARVPHPIRGSLRRRAPQGRRTGRCGDRYPRARHRDLRPAPVPRVPPRAPIRSRARARAPATRAPLQGHGASASARRCASAPVSRVAARARRRARPTGTRRGSSPARAGCGVRS